MSEKTDIKSMNLEELKTFFFRYGGRKRFVQSRYMSGCMCGRWKALRR